jgi:hypothetical protein
MGTPAEFCQNAHECSELAKHTTNSVHRGILLDLAVKWLQLAGVTRREIELMTTAGTRSAA